MIIFFDKNGTLKEIIGERPFRSGDSKKDKIYIYWDGEHSISEGWVKFLKADETYYEYIAGQIEKRFYTTGDKLKKIELPNEPLRNFEYFSYNHTYTDGSGNNHVGYEVYEIEVPDGVLASAISTSNVCVCSIRFNLMDGNIEQLGVIPFSVDATTGIIPDNSINETQYNYLLRLLGEKQNKIIWNVGGLLDESLTSLRADGKSYGISGGSGGDIDIYLKTIEKTPQANYDQFTIEGKNYTTTISEIIKARPNKYVKETSISGKELSMTNVVNDVETIIAYGAGASELALQSDLNKEIQDRKDADDKKVDRQYVDVTNNSINKISNEAGNQGVSLTSETIAVGTETAKKSGIATHNAPSSANGLLAEIYGVEKNTNTGTRIIVKQNKIYYTKDKNDISVVDSDEIATKADLGGGYEAGDNITFSAGTGTNQKINANQIEDINGSVNPLKTYSAKFINELLATKTQKKIDAGGGKYSLIFNEADGGGAKFEDTVRRAFSFVGVNEDAFDGIGAQIYDIQKDTSGNIESGSWLDVKKDGIYYYNGTYKTPAQRDINDNKLATLKDVATGFEKILTAGDNISIDRTNPNAPVISSNQINDVTISTSKAYSNSKVNELLAKKTNIVETGTNGKAYVVNEEDGGGVKFENNNGEHSFLGVNDGVIGAQIYQKDATTNVGTRINVTKGGIYYTNGKTDATYTANDEIATKNDIATEKTRAEGAEGTLTTNLTNEVTRATTAETTISTNLATNYYNKTSTDTELAKKANDFDIDTATLQWDTTGTLRKLKAIIPAAMRFKGSKDYTSEVIAITTHEDGDLYWAWKDDRTEPQATAPVVNAFIVWSGTDNKWVYAGSTDVDLSLYLKTADAETTYQHKLVNQVNIASIGSSLLSQISLVDNQQILITLDGGDLSVSSDRIDVNINGVNCTFAGGMHSYHQRVNKNAIYPLLLTFTADSGFTLPDSVVAELDSTPLVLNTDYTWNKTNGQLKILQAGIDKGKATSAVAFVLKVTGE